jgi:hypothetical protein
MDIKKEGVGFIKTLGAIITSFGVLWIVVEPPIEDYLHGVIEDFHEEDKKMIEEMKVEILKLKVIIDSDLNDNIDRTNDIIDEIHYIYPNSRLKKE